MKRRYLVMHAFSADNSGGSEGAGGSSNTGYNKAEIEALATVINDTAQAAGTGIIESLTNGIITPISEVWFMPEAVKFFEGFKETVANSGTTITEIFDSFRQAVQQAGEDWANNTIGEGQTADLPVLSEVEIVELDLNVEAIQTSDSNGNIVIDETGANDVASKLNEVQTEIEDKLAELATNLNADTAFIGHGQSDKISECFTEVSKSVERVFAYLTEGDNNLKSQIDKAVEKYAEVAEGISTAFENTQSEESTEESAE